MALSGGHKLQAHLAGIAKKVSKGQSVRVGFLEGAKYPDHTNVAQVAFWNEYGTKTAPPRPFFRNMIAEKSPSWGKNLRAALKAEDYNGHEALSLMGDRIKNDLQMSITAMTEPALSPITVMLRGMRSHDQSLVVTGKTVAEAAERVAAGKTDYGASTKPLIDSNQMRRSVDYEVDSGS